MATYDEHDNVKHTLKVTPRDELPDDGTILPHAWAMKKKASGRHKARLNTYEHMNKDEENYDTNNSASLEVNEVTLRVVLALMLILKEIGKKIDVKGTFLHVQFTNEKHMFIEVP